MTTVEPIRSITDLKKVESVLAKQSQRNLLFFTIGTNCGLRISDILALNVGDVRGKTHIQIIEKKTGKQLFYPYNTILVNFSIGGTCSMVNAYLDRDRVYLKHGIITKRTFIKHKIVRTVKRFFSYKWLL